MPVRLLRRILMILLVGAFFGATTLEVFPGASAASAEMTMPDQDNGDGNPVPCKAVTLNCLSDLGCIFMLSLPAPQLTIATDLAWSPVVYGLPSNAAAGRSIAPDLGPPIQSA
jgi:hypothetical protein